MKKAWVCLLLFFGLGIQAQVDPNSELENEIESIAESSDENQTDLTQLAEDLEQLKQNPIALNFTDAEELQKIPYLNVFQINSLLSYRKSTGLIYSKYELIAIHGFDQALAEKIAPFINFGTENGPPQLKLKNVLKYGRHDVIFRAAQVLEDRAGYTDTSGKGYLGNPQNYYLRYKWHYSKYLSVGLVAQHDPGEPFGGSYQNLGADFWAGHIALQNYGKLKKLIVGDYQVEFGQGLALWSSLAFGKSASSTEIKRYARGFKPFSGSEENRFFRGAAATYRFFDHLDVSAFYSKNTIDANRIVKDTTDEFDEVSSLQTTGMHRTQNEIDDKDANQLQTLGANANFKGQQFSVGITGVNYQLEHGLQAGSQPYQQFRFSGKQLSNFSIDANYLLGRNNFFGELAGSDNGALYGTVGLQSNPADGIYLSMLYRNMEKDYQSIFNGPFGESGNYGESGIYMGLQWQLNKKVLLKSYIDMYQFSWLKFGVDAPSKGQDILGQLDFNWSRYAKSYLRVKTEEQETNGNNETAIRTLTTQRKTQLRLHHSYSLKGGFSLASRLEYSFYQKEETNDRGFALMQDFKYQLKKLPLQFATRIAFIETDSYDTRMYAYEKDVLYAFSIPAYYGHSTRFYLLGTYKMNRTISLQVRYAISRYTDRDVISSGLQEIEGNKISDLKIQLRIRL